MTAVPPTQSTQPLSTLLRREQYRKALQVLDGPNVRDLEPAEALALRAEALAGLAEFEAAMRAANEALERDPHSARAHTVLANIFAELSNDPGQGPARISTGSAIATIFGDQAQIPQRAVQHYQAALASDPHYAAALYGLGTLLLRAEQLPIATELLKRAAAMEPDNWRYQAGVARLAPPGERAAQLRAAYRLGLQQQPVAVRLRLRLLTSYLTGPFAGMFPPRVFSASISRLGADAYQRLLAGRVLLTYLLLAINAVMWLILERNGGSQDNATLYRFGASDGFAIVHVHEWWRLLTPVFLHAGLAHLAINSMSLYFVGTLFERSVGHWRFLYVYVFAGIGGSIASVAAHPVLGVGASGAIFGIFGAIGVFYFQNRRLFGFLAKRLVAQVVLISAVNLLFLRSIPNVDNAAHLGGLLAGMIAAAVVGPLLPHAREGMTVDAVLRDRRSPRLLASLLVLAAIALILAAVMVIAWNPAGA